MRQTFGASVLAISLAISAITPAPVQAKNNDQLGNFIAGAIALMIIGKAIEGNHIRRHTPKPVSPPPPVTNKILPRQCYFETRDRFGDRGVYGKRCLFDEMRQAHKLPKQCEDRVRIRQGKRANIYDARCLLRKGYKEEAWRY